jgi:hypothetical protein
MPSRYLLTIALLLISLCLPTHAQTPPPEEEPPADFTRIEFEGKPELSASLNAYLWRHFKNRGGNGNVLFNQEYLLLSDIWLNATEPHRNLPIQQVHRDNLLSMQLDDEGYVNTHQHFSHAHDWGWPFPVWTQAGMGPGEWQGITAGWLFQEQPDLRGWAADYLKQSPELSKYYGSEAVQSWHVLSSYKSEGIVDKAWQVSPIEPVSKKPFELHWPEGVSIDAFNAPFIQIRWKSEFPLPPSEQPYLFFWQESNDDSPSPELNDNTSVIHCVDPPVIHRMNFSTHTPPSPDGFIHTILPMHEHPEWNGTIENLQIVLPASGGTYRIDSIFTCYDTRHTINNPIYILASAEYFKWTQDTDFLRQQINKMRTALHFMRNSMKGAERNYIRVEWPGHDGLAGFRIKEDGSKEQLPGHGIGSNYWDLMPFGWDDFYATYQYFAATNAMAEMEEWIATHPGWNVPQGALAFDHKALEDHAKQIKEKANELFWNKETGRYYASIDKNGKAYDYGYTFLNLEAIWYGIVPEDRAKSIMDWVSGQRIVEGDTSTGADIYHWRFGPRATTKRNVEWYGQGWYNPEHIPWGGQVQDGGAVLGFTFYDLFARLKVYGPDNAVQRLEEIMAWDREVQAAGGYRAYYADGSHGTTLQGCGTPGGLGIDCEFYESSMLPAFVIHGLAGLYTFPGELDTYRSSPRYTRGVPLPGLSVQNLKFKGELLSIKAAGSRISINTQK